MDNLTCNRIRNTNSGINRAPTISEPSTNSSSSSSTSSSQIDLNLPLDRRSNITILTDSSPDNWTLRKNLNKAASTETAAGWINDNRSVDSVQTIPIVVPNQEIDTCISNSSISENAETVDNVVINQVTSNKEVVRIRKASKFYGSGNNKQQVLCSLDLSLREGEILN